MYNQLNELHLDALQEVGSIGAGHAATSLSVLLERPVALENPRVRLATFDEAAALLGGPEMLAFGVMLELVGDIEGMILFLQDAKSVHLMLGALMGREYDNYDKLDTMALSALQEVGNILAGAYVRALAELTGLFVNIKPPAVSVDMAGALLNAPLVRYGRLGDQVLLVEGNMAARGLDVRNAVVLFAEPHSLGRILTGLGIK